MKHPKISATAHHASPDPSSAVPVDPVIKLRLDKPLHWDWELTTSADTFPVVQLLDKDGRVLVETTGRTAQRARGSFRNGLQSHETFPESVEATELDAACGNRNVDGFSSIYGSVQVSGGFRPRKSRSAVSLGSETREKRIRKRHSSGMDAALREIERKRDECMKRYSVGEFLTNRIVDDLRSPETMREKTSEEIAEERCDKVRAYLKGREDTSNVEKTSPSGQEVRDSKLKQMKEFLASRRRRDNEKDENASQEELARTKEFLRGKIREKMDAEGSSTASKLNDIRKRYSENGKSEGIRYRTRKVRSDASIRFDPEVFEREKSRTIRRQTDLEEAKSRSACGRTRSVVISECGMATGAAKKRHSSGSDRRKVYRKTKSDVLLNTAETSLDSDKDYYSANSLRRIKSEDNVERSWKEYKERKRHEKLVKKSESVAEEDFMKKPRWKDLQNAVCRYKNCRVCQNTRDDEELPPTDRCNSVAETFVTESTTDGERCSTRLQENYLLVDQSKSRGVDVGEKTDSKGIVAKVMVNNECAEARMTAEKVASSLTSPDHGYNSMQKGTFKEYKGLCANSNVKKSDTFKIVDGGEERDEDVAEELTPQSNEDITRDYFKRVYALLKQRQEYARRLGAEDPYNLEDTTSSNFPEPAQRRRRRRRRKEAAAVPDAEEEGDEVIAVGPACSGRDSWTVQRLLVNTDPGNLRLRRQQSQQEEITGAKKLRHPGCPPPSTKVNAKDISKYFGSPNKENAGPRYGVNKPQDQPRREKSREQDQDHDHPEKERVLSEKFDKPVADIGMGSNLSRHNGKGLTGRRTQSSGNLCDPKGKLNHVGKMLVPCSGGQKERYKFCGSLPNHLDEKESGDINSVENNNVISDTISGNLGGTLPHKKRALGVHFSDGGPAGTLDLVKHRSQESLEGDPWRYQHSSDLDLVRCKHGNFDLVRRGQGVDAVDGDTSRRYARGISLDEKCHRSSDLDLVGTLPKRRQDSRKMKQNLEAGLSRQRSTADVVDDDLLMKLVHKPDCELMKHRQLNRGVDLRLTKLSGSEPQDQGYASERSPEDEHPPSLPGEPFPTITPESTFRVTLQKSSRGLGLSVSGGGTAGPVRVKRLFPQQPAALSNKLQPGDILLAANGLPLTGLTNYEALEVLRTTPSTVELVVCRPPGADTTVSPLGAPPPPPTRREPPPPLRIFTPLPPLQIEPCGEFDIEMTKVAGSLGFTLRKADSSALGHYVRALVREPALSDGRIQPGDKIVAVDGAPLSPMSHEEAVALLRQCGPRVKLRLYRDLAQTPVSALSPTEPDHPLRPPRTSLRQEAVDMLCDLAVRKLSPGTSSGSSCNNRSPSTATSNSPRRLRRPATRTPTAENDQGDHQKYFVTQMSTSQADTSDSDQCSIKTQITNSQPNTPGGSEIIDPPPLYDLPDTPSKPNRPSFLDLSAPQGKPHFQFGIDSDSDFTGPLGGPAIVTASDSNVATDCDAEELPKDIPRPTVNGQETDTDLPSEPASMPPVLSSTSKTDTAFSYKNPAYQSANPACGVGSDASSKNKLTHSSDQDIPGTVLGGEDSVGTRGLLKWKGVMFTSNDDSKDSTRGEDDANGSTDDSSAAASAHEQGNHVFMVELTRGWNSRLGFSLQPEGDCTVISVVHADSVAAKDGRLKQGDVLLMVNDESVENMSTAEIIDLLRKIRGSIGITVMRRCNNNESTT